MRKNFMGGGRCEKTARLGRGRAAQKNNAKTPKMGASANERETKPKKEVGICENNGSAPSIRGGSRSCGELCHPRHLWSTYLYSG